MSLRASFRRGDPMIWFTGSALGICILMIVALIGVILVNGLSFFWPARLEQLTLKDGSVSGTPHFWWKCRREATFHSSLQRSR